MEQPTELEQPNAKKINPIVWILIAAIIVGGGYMLFQSGQKNAELEPEVEVLEEEPATNLNSEAATTAETANEIKTFTIDGNNFTFSVNEIKVKQGDKVKIVFNNTAGYHDWVLDEFNARTPQIQAGQTATVEFIADKTGTFEYYCSVGQHRQMGMKGNLIVE